MANLARAIKEEITRLARKEIKSQSNSMKQAVVQHRHDIALLKRQLHEHAKKIAYLQNQERKRFTQEEVADEAMEGARFSARSVKAHRKRLKLSAEAYGRLIGVSGQTVYHWEQGKSRPRKSQFLALVSARDLSKREAMARLELLGNANSKPASRPRKAAGRKSAKRR